MIDHVSRIRAQHQQTLENAEMERLEKHAAPLLLAFLLIVASATIASITDRIGVFINHYNGIAATNNMLAQCMNGHLISMGDSVLKCDVREYKLVAGIANAKEEQP